MVQSFSLYHRQRKRLREGRRKQEQTAHVRAIITNKHSGSSDRGGLGEAEALLKTSIQPLNINLTLTLHSPLAIPPGHYYTTARA